MIRMQPALVVLAAVTVAACSAGPGKPETVVLGPEDYAGAPIDSFHIRTGRGWEVVARDKVLLWNSPTEAYLLTVSRSCQSNLHFAKRLSVTDTGNVVSRNEVVEADDAICHIDTIQPVDVLAMRKAQRAEKEGAE